MLISDRRQSMKKSILFVSAIFFLILFFSGCKTTEFVWNPVGIWSFIITGDWGETWTETMNLAGSDTGGTVSGWTYFNPDMTPGTWTRAGYTATIINDFSSDSWHDIVTLIGNSTEANPNSMSGTGTWMEYLSGSYYNDWTLTFIATKTTNLQ